MNVSLPFDETSGESSVFSHLPAILWHRRWFIIVPVIVGLVAALLANVLIPAKYRSTALMLVQSPQLSGAVLGADGSDVIDRRIARISEQITSRPDLIALIEKHGLYQGERKSKPLSKVIETMKDAITLTPTGGSEADAGQGRTIAFKLSFDYPEAAPAQAVAQDLMQRIVELDASGNKEQATRQVEFLTEQAKGLNKQIADVQGKIAGINAQNGSILSNAGVMMVGGSGGSYDVQIASLQRDNAQLISQRESSRTADSRDPVVAAAEQALASAQAVYADNHPDVIMAKQRLAEARQLARSNVRKLPIEQIDQQIAFNNSQIAALRAAKSQEMSQVSSARAAQSRAPLVQTQIADLQQVLSGLNDQYKDVSAKLLAAQASARAEDEQMGEKLSVVDPPVVPDTPVWPNRLLISLLGIGGGLGLGLVLALAIEFILRPIRDPGALAALVGSPPLAMIPVIQLKQRPKQTAGRWSLERLWSRS